MYLRHWTAEEGSVVDKALVQLNIDHPDAPGSLPFKHLKEALGLDSKETIGLSKSSNNQVEDHNQEEDDNDLGNNSNKDSPPIKIEGAALIEGHRSQGGTVNGKGSNWKHGGNNREHGGSDQSMVWVIN
jgi:hypothetical protein